jgi:hypothetical protein
MPPYRRHKNLNSLTHALKSLGCREAVKTRYFEAGIITNQAHYYQCIYGIDRLHSELETTYVISRKPKNAFNFTWVILRVSFRLRDFIVTAMQLKIAWCTTSSALCLVLSARSTFRREDRDITSRLAHNPTTRE